MRPSELTDPAAILPPLYAGWVDSLLGGAIPAETVATCDDCAMCAKGDIPARAAATFFNPATKCCTYMPVLANFLVGRILADADPALAFGRQTVGARIAAGVAVTPLGLGAPASYTLLYRNSPSAFGHSRHLRCPHYVADTGACGIWRHRESTCATWFCKHRRGAVGKEFWAVLHQLLTHIEKSLARWCVLELDLGMDALGRLFPPIAAHQPAAPIDGLELDGQVDRAPYRAHWGRWAGREAAFYQECARLVDPLTWAAVLAIGGPELHIAARLAYTAHQKLLSTDVAPALQVGEFQILQMVGGRSRLATYSHYDPLDLPGALLRVLPAFDGRPTREVRADLAAGERIELSDGLIRKLVDFGILTPVEPDGEWGPGGPAGGRTAPPPSAMATPPPGGA